MNRFCIYFCVLFLYVNGEKCQDTAPGEKIRDLF
jgi:hypothetical protein